MATTTVGTNVRLVVSPDGKTLTIEIDLTKEFGPSSTGKTIIVASSQGNADIPGKPGFRLGLNLFRKP